MNRELDDKLALMVNGQLDEKGCAELEEEIENDLELAAEADFLKALQVGIKDQDQALPGAMGLARLKRTIEAEKAALATAETEKTSTEKKQPAANDFNFWKPFSVAACCMLAVQTFYMQGSNIDEPSGVAILSGNQSGVRPQLQVVFADTATAVQMREALLSINARFVNGPGALGIYTLELPEGNDLIQAQVMLSGLPFIEEVEVISKATKP